MTKKTHILYSLISICAVIAYCGFLVKNAVSNVNNVEETLPYEYQEEYYNPMPVTEPVVVEAVHNETNVEKAQEPAAEIETEHESVQSLTGFSPIFPVEGAVTKYFSEKHIYNEDTKDWRTHTGIDISAALADAVLSAEDGTVTACYEDPIWGNVIEIDHGEYISIYKNLSTLIMVKEGDSVSRGEKISGAGQSSTCEKGQPHVHFELTHYGKYVDPLELLG